MKIVISGTTGVGKSTTVNLLKSKLELMGKKVIIVGELVVNSPYFDLYFNDMAEWGFIAQLDFLLERFKQFLSIEKVIDKNDNTIYLFDRHFLEDKIFSNLWWLKQNISAFQANEYKMIWNELIAKMTDFPKIDYFILLKAEFDTIQSRMSKRGRSQEETFHIKYWKDLYWKYYNDSQYRNIFKNNSNHFLELSTDDKTSEKVVESIIKYLTKREAFKWK